MDKIFAWKTIDEEKISVNTKFSFGETINSDNISEWTSRHFDLRISLEVFLSGVEISEYLQENESASWIIIWRGDKRITGTGIRVRYEQGIPQVVECIVPSGSLISGLEAELFLVTQKNESEAPSNTDAVRLRIRGRFRISDSRDP